MKKYIALILCVFVSGIAIAKQPLPADKLDSALKKEVAKACDSSECYVKALKEKNYQLVENTLAKYIDTADRNDYVYATAKVGDADVTTLEYLIYTAELAQARKLFNEYLNPIIFSANQLGDILLEKLVFQKNNPDRDAFAKDILNSPLMPTVSSRTLKYAVTQANDEPGFKYVELLTKKTIIPTNEQVDKRRNRVGVRNPYTLPISLRTALDVAEHEIKFAQRNREDTTWLKKTRDLLKKKSL